VSPPQARTSTPCFLVRGDRTCPLDEALFVLVIVMALLGSLVYVATSFAFHASRRNLTVSYLWWYPTRFVSGTAWRCCSTRRARSLFSGDLAQQEVNPYGIQRPPA